MKRLRALFFHGRFLPVLLEAGLGAAAVLLLVFAVLHDIPIINIPATFIFLVQVPVLWAALRLAPAAGRSRGLRLLREAAFAVCLRLLVLGIAILYSGLFHAREVIAQSYPESSLNLLLFTACLLPFLVYRLIFDLYDRWRALARRSLLWTLVNSHLLVVFTLVALFSMTIRITQPNTVDSKFIPPNPVAATVLELVRGVIPWVGVSLILLLAAEAVFLPPTILFSYFTSRRFVRRIDALAAAMRRAHQGDLRSARVEPSGQDEVAQLQTDFNHMAVQLQEERDKVEHLLKNQRELAAVVSHELRTPITVMRAYLENDLGAADLPEPTRRDMQVVYQQTLSLQDLVEDLFTLSRLDAQRLDLECAWIDPAPVLARLVDTYQPLAWENKRIDLSLAPGAPLPRIWADPRRMEQTLGNLAQNAIRHTPPGGVVVLSTQTDGDWLEISLADTGEGISAEDLPHIWERFYRGSTAGRTGIGLALVKDLVEAMQGSVGVESQTGAQAGSRFWFRLRVQPPAALPTQSATILRQ